MLTAPLTFDEAEAGKRYPVAELWLSTSSDEGTSVCWSVPLRATVSSVES